MRNHSYHLQFKLAAQAALTSGSRSGKSSVRGKSEMLEVLSGFSSLEPGIDESEWVVATKYSVELMISSISSLLKSEQDKQEKSQKLLYRMIVELRKSVRKWVQWLTVCEQVVSWDNISESWRIFRVILCSGLLLLILPLRWYLFLVLSAILFRNSMLVIGMHKILIYN